MAISRPFLITLIAIGYIITAAVELFVAATGFVPNFLLAFIANPDASKLNLVGLAIWQLFLGVFLFKGIRIAWWVTVLGAYLPILVHIVAGLRGEPWAWGTILWNIAVISYTGVLRARSVLMKAES